MATQVTRLALPMPPLVERLHAQACPSGQDDLVEPPPLQGHNLGALHLDYFDLLASLAFTVICQSLYHACFRWPPVHVGSLAGFPHHFLIC